MLEKPVTRRTVAKGVAWSVPVVAMASVAPALAASGDYTLVFAAALAAGNACSATTAGQLLLTKDGAAAGQKITVTLPIGVEWNDGSTGDKTFTSD